MIETNPIVLDFFARSPTHWAEVDKQRVANHLVSFDLSSRFSTQAANEVSILIDQRRGLLSTLSPDDFCKFLLDIANSSELKPNHWKKVMYQALAANEWFCREQF